MKRLCVFYKYALDWAGKPVEWIVCKACAKRVRQGAVRHLMAKGLADAANAQQAQCQKNFKTF